MLHLLKGQTPSWPHSSIVDYETLDVSISMWQHPRHSTIAFIFIHVYEGVVEEWKGEEMKVFVVR